ncbi:unnamed protein product [Amoebophrya sp. A120]|nr:unnamed protein product [Amoebophrya sp. A120]|eukprot:GSA120T00004159001.1
MHSCEPQISQRVLSLRKTVLISYSEDDISDDETSRSSRLCPNAFRDTKCLRKRHFSGCSFKYQYVLILH